MKGIDYENFLKINLFFIGFKMLFTAVTFVG